MPTRTPKGTTLGFIGTGDAAEGTIGPLLDDLIESEGGAIKFIIPVSKQHLTDAMADVVAYAVEKEIPYEAVHDSAAAAMKKGTIKDALGGASKTHSITRLPGKVVSLLTNADNPKLLVLWDDEDEESLKAVDKALENEIECRDLSEGLVKLEADTGEGGEEEPGDDEPTGDGENGEEPGEDAGEAEPYTEEELAEFSLKDLKAICEENGIEVASGSRSGTYIKAILAAQEAEAEEEPEPGDGEDEGEPDDDGNLDLGGEGLDTGAIAELLTDFANDLIDALAGEQEGDEPPAPLTEAITRLENVEKKVDRVIDLIGTLGVSVDKLTKALPEKPSAATQRALEAREEGGDGEEEPATPRAVRGRPRKDGTPPQPRERDEDGNLIKKAPPTGGRPRKDGTPARPAAAKPGVRRIRK